MALCSSYSFNFNSDDRGLSVFSWFWSFSCLCLSRRKHQPCKMPSDLQAATTELSPCKSLKISSRCSAQLFLAFLSVTDLYKITEQRPLPVLIDRYLLLHELNLYSSLTFLCLDWQECLWIAVNMVAHIPWPRICFHRHFFVGRFI